jgi:hypothetical protein
MTVTRRKGDPGLADILFSRIVRARGRCERCGIGATATILHTAHIVRRRYSAVRCVEDNAWCLCPSCHHDVDEWAWEHQKLVKETIGTDRYLELVGLAMAGPQVSSKLFWKNEVERLKLICQARGIDTRRQIPRVAD